MLFVKFVPGQCNPGNFHRYKFSQQQYAGICLNISIYIFLGFFHDLPNRSIVPLIRSALVSSRLAVTIHSMYSFLLLKDKLSKNADSFLFFFKAIARSPGSFTSLVCGFTQLNTSRGFEGLASFLRSSSVLARKPNTDQVSLKEIR